jgi:hypothetical protein
MVDSGDTSTQDRAAILACQPVERPKEGNWTKQLSRRPKDGESEQTGLAWPAVLEAELLFQDIANGNRVDKKMPPVSQEQGDRTPF